MKNLLRLGIGGALLVGTAMVSTTDEATGWSTIGGDLGIGQRDFRIYNNFTDAQANNNLSEDSVLIGYTGAPLAIWKAGAEWDARPFGNNNSSSDPLQQQLGDGGANFNFFWNGEASGVGSANDNINSELSGGSGGVLAFTETPISDGWRIRYYSSWTWQDGPGNDGSVDLQGVACHELGHALGLGHSSVWAATMYPSISGSGTGERSIVSDDWNGLRYIYGSRSSIMPEITDITGSLTPGGSAVVVGDNFTSNMKVWLDSDVVDAGQNGGNPYLIENLSSTNNGTQIPFTVPNSGFLRGALHVKDATTNNHRALSDGHPFDVQGIQTDTIFLTATDTTPNTGDRVTFSASGAPANAPYILYYSFQNTGTMINGHPFDIGSPNGQVGSGNTSSFGTFSLSRTVPQGAAGRTVYMEVGAVDAGITYDSNMITISVN